MVIHAKEQLIEQIEHSFNDLIKWIESQDDQLFEEVFTEGKWSTAQHLDHLIRSTKPLNQALKMPRMMIRTMFGKPNRPERTFDEVVKKYRTKLEEGIAVASGKFAPKVISNDQKNVLIQNFKEEKEELKEIVSKWKDENLSKYLIPHPILGKMTIREMLFFTVYHTSHHHTILKERYRQS